MSGGQRKGTGLKRKHAAPQDQYVHGYLCNKKNGELCTYEGLVDLKCHVLISTTLYLQLFIVHLMHISKGNLVLLNTSTGLVHAVYFFYNSKCLV